MSQSRLPVRLAADLEHHVSENLAKLDSSTSAEAVQRARAEAAVES